MNTSHKTTLLALAALALLPATTQAKPRTAAQKQQVAAEAIHRALPLTGRMRVQGAPMRQLQATDAYTVYGYDGGGFAIVANDDLLPAVLGYSDSSYDATTQNDGFRWWLSAVGEIATQKVGRGQAVRRAAKPDTSRFPEAVPTLMTTKWGQYAPYNNLCPIATDGTGRCLTGCAATSTAQVFYYHKGPKNGMGQRTIYYPYGMTSGVAISVDFENEFYDWNNMIDSYDQGYTAEEGDAVAMLMRDLAVVADMDYGSEAQGGSGAQHEVLAQGLQRYYGLTDVRYLEREDYTEQEWMNIIYDQIARQQPIVYGGFTKQREGHSFVFDGYDKDGLVHVNWGWNGEQDGYYDVALLDPVGYKFTEMQEAIINITPEPAINRVSGSVAVSQPGALRGMLEGDSFYNYDTLAVSGDINAADLRALREMGGVDENGNRTHGRLQRLDLSQARIVGGTDYYLVDKGQKLTIAADNTLPDKLFYGCSMGEINFPATGVAHFGKGVWAYCNKLATITLTPTEDADFVYDDGMVYDKDKTTLLAATPLTRDDIHMADGVKAIADYAFAGCSMVRRIAIGPDVKTIGREAFGYCWSMDELRVRPKEIPQLATDVFQGANTESCRLAVRAGSKARYAALAQWKDFKNITEFGTTVKARNLSRLYGDDNPELTFTVSGDKVDGQPELSCEATPQSPVGRYKIRIARGTIADEDTEFEDGYLVVKPAPLTATADDATRAFGLPNPEFTIRYDGFRNGDGPADLLELPQAACEADANSPEGVYEITVSGGDADNYELSHVSGKLTVTPISAVSQATEATEAGREKNVYTLTGQLVGRTTRGLPAGVYLVGGKKVIVK